MFTGIIEDLGTIVSVQQQGNNIECWIHSKLTPQLKIDQSVAHNGVCLTVVEINGESYRVTAVEETLKKTNLSGWKPGIRVNLERSLRVGDRLDGHFVQGHVDTTGHCLNQQQREGSWVFDFGFPQDFAELIIEKGSIAINGVSLTLFDVEKDRFRVTIIPYTFEHTGFQSLTAGDKVNLEFDVLGKYLLRQKALSLQAH